MIASTKHYLIEHLNQAGILLIGLISGIMVPIAEMLLFTGFMIFFDAATGIWASKRRGEVLSSTKMKRSVSKVIIYPLAFIISSWAERILPNIPFIKGAATILIAVEGKSVLENFNDILGFNVSEMVKVFITHGKSAMINFKKKEQESNLKTDNTEKDEDSGND